MTTSHRFFWATKTFATIAPLLGLGSVLFALLTIPSPAWAKPSPTCVEQTIVEVTDGGGLIWLPEGQILEVIGGEQKVLRWKVGDTLLVCTTKAINLRTKERVSAIKLTR